MQVGEVQEMLIFPTFVGGDGAAPVVGDAHLFVLFDIEANHHGAGYGLYIFSLWIYYALLKRKRAVANFIYAS